MDNGVADSGVHGSNPVAAGEGRCSTKPVTPGTLAEDGSRNEPAQSCLVSNAPFGDLPSLPRDFSLPGA